MSTYSYTDEDGDKLLIKEALGVLSHAYINVSGSSALYLPPSEAPKAAQAILDAAGVKGVVIVGSNINVTLGAEAEQAWEKRQRAENEEWLARCAEEKAAEEAAAKKAHDDLRTSPIALKALALYNRGCIGSGPYASWDAVNCGAGCSDDVVRKYIEQAEAEEAKEKEAAERLAARRLDIYKELGGAFATNVSWNSPMGKAVLRIIELEDKARDWARYDFKGRLGYVAEELVARDADAEEWKVAA